MKSEFDEDFGGVPRRKSSLVTVPVNGHKLQTLRQLAGLTQEQLAEKAGYSDRLIRKAEASGPLRKSTIADLAAALSTTVRKVAVEDLMFSHDFVSGEITAFLLHGSMAPEVSLDELLHPDFTIIVAGQELKIPFAGTYCGPRACESFRNQLRQSLGTVEYMPQRTRCFSAARETCVHAITQFQRSPASNTKPIPIEIWWFLKARFEDCRFMKIDLHYDTGCVCRVLGRL